MILVKQFNSFLKMRLNTGMVLSGNYSINYSFCQIWTKDLPGGHDQDCRDGCGHVESGDDIVGLVHDHH